jgi:comEA protein
MGKITDTFMTLSRESQGVENDYFTDFYQEPDSEKAKVAVNIDDTADFDLGELQDYASSRAKTATLSETVPKPAVMEIAETVQPVATPEPAPPKITRQDIESIINYDGDSDDCDDESDNPLPLLAVRGLKGQLEKNSKVQEKRTLITTKTIIPICLAISAVMCGSVLLFETSFNAGNQSVQIASSEGNNAGSASTESAAAPETPVVTENSEATAPETSTETPAKPAETKENATKTSACNGKVNLNTATASELQELKGVGPSTAEKIVAYRTENAGFASIEDLMNVTGIGEKKYESVKDSICT